MLRKYLFISAVFLLLVAFTHAQIKIVPQPQKITVGNEKISAQKFFLQTNSAVSAGNLNLLKTILPLNEKEGVPVIIDRLKTGNSEAYGINISANGIKFFVNGDRSLFYALQTCKQLIKNTLGKKEIPHCIIEDHPEVTHRGTVEGFYGTPWSFSDRVSQLKFYGSLKLNTYIYGPKDDPYHSSPNWRKDYPADKAAEIKKLVNEAKNNQVDFVWAIHPGQDIQWNLSDSIAVLHKLQSMYHLGIRAFAVFFDDISGEGTDAEKQAGLLNYLHKEFVEKKKDVLPLIMCPTEYNKSWANPKQGTYLDILGEKLHPSIYVMWTGDRVVADMDMPTLEWINKRIRRPAYIWWNYPVSDYVRDHLLMGPVYGNATNISGHIAGFVSNPMERAEASKTGIFGMALYTWNMQQYDSAQAFSDAMNFIMPEAPDAFKLFSENNSDLGANGHGYRRKESVFIQPKIEQLWKNIQKNEINNALLSEVKNYYKQIEKTPADIRGKSQNKNLVAEIEPWLKQFNLLGKSGVALLDLYENKDRRSISETWNELLSVNSFLAEMKKTDQTENQNPYQPGVKTGSLVLTPFITDLSTELNELLLEKISGNKTFTSGKTTNEQLYTNVQQIKGQPLRITEKEISISPLLEVITLKPNGYIGLQWLNNREAQSLSFNFDVEKIKDKGQFEYSKDGINWSRLPFDKETKRAELSLKHTEANFVRFRNTSEDAQQIYLKNFSVKTKESATSNNGKLALDKSLKTFVVVPASRGVKLKLKGKSNKTELILLMNNFEKNIRIFSGNKILYAGADNYISIPLKTLKKTEEITIQNAAEKAVQLYEVFTH